MPDLDGRTNQGSFQRAFRFLKQVTIEFIIDKAYAQLIDQAKATRTPDFNKLLELGLIVREGRGRNTYYRRPTRS